MRPEIAWSWARQRDEELIRAGKGARRRPAAEGSGPANRAHRFPSAVLGTWMIELGVRLVLRHGALEIAAS